MLGSDELFATLFCQANGVNFKLNARCGLGLRLALGSGSGTKSKIMTAKSPTIVVGVISVVSQIPKFVRLRLLYIDRTPFS
ncbi:hypothetical protein O9929_06540 [Vibrio lentus]|nr:hypothetical protein [Vibrio lentus]